MHYVCYALTSSSDFVSTYPPGISSQSGVHIYVSTLLLSFPRLHLCPVTTSLGRDPVRALSPLSLQASINISTQSETIGLPTFYHLFNM
jgi:hypothetical protein